MLAQTGYIHNLYQTYIYGEYCHALAKGICGYRVVKGGANAIDRICIVIGLETLLTVIKLITLINI